MSSSLIFLLLAGFLGGLVDSIAGGGGLITVPALMAFGLPPVVVLGTNKVAASMGSFTSAVRYRCAGYVQRIAWPMAAIAFFTSMLGAKAAVLLPPHHLKTLILLALLCVGVFVLLRRDFGGDATVPTVASPSDQRPLAFFWAAAIGFYDGMIGPGTGSFLAVVFVVALGRDLLSATANAKVVNFATNLASALVFTVGGSVRWWIALPFGLSILAGAYAGSGLAVRRGIHFIRIVLVAVVFLVVLRLWYSQ